MAKLVIKITVYQSIDPDLYDSVSDLPLRRRAAVIRRWWRRGLQPGGQMTESPRPADPPGVAYTREPAAAVAAGQGSDGADGKRLRQDLDGQGLSGLSAFV